MAGPTSASSAPPLLPYRPEVDGLRAIAVVAVILFHAHIGPLTGGFVGVDVFFVISGFLITGILLREQDAGSFTLARFYARRARRILPALLVVGLACVPPALLLMTSAEWHDFSRMLASACVGASNLVLAGTSGYFAADSELRPLLHTWSLGVEEQFYLVFPVLLLATRRLRRTHVVLMLSVLAVGSLALAEWGTANHRDLAFYLAPTRAWELLAGALCAHAAAGACPTAQRLSPAWQARAATWGLAAVATSLVLFDELTPAPGFFLLLPVLGTAAVLLYASPANLAGRLLAQRPLVAIGLVSYSAYLWHQPLLAYARLYGHAPLDVPAQWAVVAATAVLAGLSWRFIEQPFRHGGRTTRRTLLVAAGASGGLAALAVAGAVAADTIVPPPSPEIRAAFEQPARSAECFDIGHAHERPDGWSCAVNPAAGVPSFMLFGDSHALQVLGAFEAAARASGRAGVFAGFSGCAPLQGVVPLTRPDQGMRDCAALNRRVLEYVTRERIHDIYLVARWSYYTGNEDQHEYLNAIGLRPGDAPTLAGSRAAFAEGFARTLRAYGAAQVRVHLLEQVPQQRIDPQRAYYGRTLSAKLDAAGMLRRLAVPLEQHRRLQAFPASVFRRPDPHPPQLLNVDALFCDLVKCAIGTPEAPYYADTNHLSVYGARLLVPALTASLRDRGGSPGAANSASLAAPGPP